MKRIIALGLLFIVSQTLSAQEMTQTLRGRILDAQSQFPLIGATILIVNSDPLIGTTTDIDGYYKIENLPVGTVTLKISSIGYEDQFIPNVKLSIGKQTAINISLKESLTMMEAVVIDASSREYEELNELASVSVTGFNIAETERYAGSLGDPGRMAANYAGVSGVNDGRNDIIIRGNSPSGLLWRLEDVDIPSPNHYAAMGTTGGPVTILNNNQLANSEFYTGAFPSMYGNALSGVFDLKLRNGNSEKREQVIQTGFNGLEVGLEGPFKVGGRASYIANYRYSLPAIMHQLGFGTGTGTAVPQYSDVSMKLNFPTKNGTFKVFGVGGLSAINLLGSETDIVTGEDQIFNGLDTDVYNISNTGILGTAYQHFFDENTYLRNSLTLSGNEFIADLDTITRNAALEVTAIDPYVLNDFAQWRLSYSNELNKKFNARNTLNVGSQVDWINMNLIQEVYRNYDQPATIGEDGQTFLVKAYVAWKFRINEKTTLNTGLNYINLTLNEASHAIEPRLGIRYQISPKSSLNFAMGRHSQIQGLTVYFNQTYLSDGSTIQTNRDLGLTKSDHIIAGFEQQIGNSWKVKSEVYYQRIFDAPIESDPSWFSMLNTGADFGLPSFDSLVNEGTGRNVGLELTVEKYLNNGWYTMTTATLYDAQYTASDEITRNTAFSGNYVLNALGGKEFKIGKYNSLLLDTRISYAGNRRYIPIDEILTSSTGQVHYVTEEAYENRYPDYFRFDIKVGFKTQMRRVSQEWHVDLQNLTNRKNIQGENFNFSTNEVYQTYQLGFWPMVKWRLLF
ncbi:MAG: TonB-dependent receptor [Cyclobacteriaceae bacterium]